MLLIFFGLFVAAFGVLLVYAGSIYEYRDTNEGAELLPFDAIVVLAGARGRISFAADLWVRYFESEERGGGHPTPILYVSGMGQNSTFQSFESQVRPGVRKFLKPQDVVIEAQSTNTVENILYLIKYAQTRGWRNLLIVTSPYHMRRSIWIVKRLLRESKLPINVQTMTVYQELFGVDEWREHSYSIRVTIEEYLKWLYITSTWEADRAWSRFTASQK